MNGLSVPPPVWFGDRLWTPGRLLSLAASWRDDLEQRLEGTSAPVGVVVAPHPESIALLFAVGTFNVPIVLLPVDRRSWQSSPPLPRGTTVVVAPSAGDALVAGDDSATVLQIAPPSDDDAARERTLPPRQSPGVIFLTSGSTGGPKPVYRTWSAVTAQGEALNRALPFVPRGLLGVLPLSGSQGFVNSFVQAALLGVPLGLVPRTDHRTLLAAFESRRYDYVSLTPFFVSLLARCPGAEPPMAAPAIVRVAGGRVTPAIVAAFRERFGTTPMAQFGTTEHGSITLAFDDGIDRSAGHVGRPLEGVDLLVGDSPSEPAEAGAAARVWVRTPWRMEGYGYPPHLTPRADVDGWSPTEDLGELDDGGTLTLIGRIDGCFKAASGHLVSPDHVSAALLTLAGVTDAVVVPVPSDRGMVIGALIEGTNGIDAAAIRRHATTALPAWMQPQVVGIAEHIPRVGGGKPDRQRSIELLTSLL